ncbi:hypothetical protein ACJX0J_027760 [Zea mays]
MTFGYEFFIIFVMFLNIDQYREVSIQFVLPFIFIVVIDIICNIVCILPLHDRFIQRTIYLYMKADSNLCFKPATYQIISNQSYVIFYTTILVEKHSSLLVRKFDSLGFFKVTDTVLQFDLCHGAIFMCY